MPTVRPCIERIGRVGCPKYALPGKSRCELHEQEHERNRRTPSQRVTESARWKRLRREFIEASKPWTCGICHLPIATYGEIEVDHRIPIADGGAPFDRSNLRLSHRSCNRRRRATRERRPWHGSAAHKFPWETTG